MSLVGVDLGIIGHDFMNVKHEAEEKSRRRRAPGGGGTWASCEDPRCHFCTCSFTSSLIYIIFFVIVVYFLLLF